MRKFLASSAEERKSAVLQCGRIYKDADIASARVCVSCGDVAINVAASIKMRKCAAQSVPDIRGNHAFNVAASIKMRK